MADGYPRNPPRRRERAASPIAICAAAVAAAERVRPSCAVIVATGGRS